MYMHAEWWLLALLALSGLVFAAYTHIRLRFHTATRFQAELTRVVLLLIGMAVGWLAVRWQTDAPVPVDMLSFLMGFGLVHLPAAFILWSKRQRGVYR
jgi:predicted MFS family arabinose efflux permease